MRGNTYRCPCDARPRTETRVNLHMTPDSRAGTRVDRHVTLNTRTGPQADTQAESCLSAFAAIAVLF